MRRAKRPDGDHVRIPDTSASRPEPPDTVPIILALAAAIAPHIPDLPLWITLWCVLMLGYTLIRLKTGWPRPSPRVCHLLTVLAVFGLLAGHGLVIDADAFVGLMCLMAAIKPFEMPTHRHKMITILLTYFISITALFRSDSIFIVVYMLFSVFVTTTALIRINAPDREMRRCRRLSAAILAQALPLVVILFLVFPRLPESLFGIQDPGRGRSGFSEVLQPGGISSMALDRTPAFRVEFLSGRPRPEQLYWRGVVFQAFDGRTWRPLVDRTPAPGNGNPPEHGQTIGYKILMAPHNSHWLMALDRPLKGPDWTTVGQDNCLTSRIRITQKTQYQAVSQLPDTGRPVPDPGDAGRRAAAGLPGRIAAVGNLNPRARSLARKLTENSDASAEKADAILSYFRDNGFVYSLNPPKSGSAHSVDEFIFEARKGYCEHYASAFAFMMNAAGVPARVVGGYLGGELNPYGGYLIVRQSYAHAWAEYFDKSRGWIRTDPTGVVAPERMTTNPDGSSALFGVSAGSAPLMTRVRFVLDTVNLRWESWFTGYSFLDQQAWAAALGMTPGSHTPAVSLTVLTVLGFLGLAVFLVRRSHGSTSSPDPVAAAFKRLEKKLSRVGLARKTGQGPVNYLKTAMAGQPDMAREIQMIMDLYISLRYKNTRPETALAEFRRRVKRLRPKRPSHRQTPEPRR